MGTLVWGAGRLAAGKNTSVPQWVQDGDEEDEDRMMGGGDRMKVMMG